MVGIHDRRTRTRSGGQFNISTVRAADEHLKLRWLLVFFFFFLINLVAENWREEDTTSWLKKLRTERWMDRGGGSEKREDVVGESDRNGR